MAPIHCGDFTLEQSPGFETHTLVLRASNSIEIALGGQGAQFRATLIVGRAERPLVDAAELRAFVEVSVGMLKSHKGFAQVDRATVTTAAGSPAILQQHTFENELGLRVQQMQLYVLSKGPALTVTVTDLSGPTFERKAGQYRKMLLSISEVSR